MSLRMDAGQSQCWHSQIMQTLSRNFYVTNQETKFVNKLKKSFTLLSDALAENGHTHSHVCHSPPWYTGLG